MNRLICSFFLDKVEKGWHSFLFHCFSWKKLISLLEELEIEYNKRPCWPEKKNVFRLFREIELEKIKIVFFGQDPYSTPYVADGLAFSSQKESYIPPSLKNIFRELERDLGCQTKIRNGSLLSWVKKGVFLLNTSLSVREGLSLSHSLIWKNFISTLIKFIQEKKKVIWVFLGQKAKKLKEINNIGSNESLFVPHPSPLNTRTSFFSSSVFTKINKLLLEMGYSSIDWCL